VNFLESEPVLGPLAREFFEIETEQNNLAGGPSHPRWKALSQRWNALYKAIAECQAQTIGGIAWRLAQVTLPIDDEEISPMTKAMLKTAFEDAKTLARERERAEVTDPAARQTDDVIKAAFEIVTSMENGLEEASVLAHGVSILAADSIHDDEKLGAVFSRLAWQIADHCKAVEERRGELFKLLHPNRDHFEKEGWPGEAAP
jgi:hypothetical protein